MVTGVNRKDAETLATQYAKRRIAEGSRPADAVLLAQMRYGLCTSQVTRIIASIKRERRAA